LVEGIIAVIGLLGLGDMCAHQSIIVIINERGEIAGGTGMHKGIGHQLNKIVVEGIPFLEKGEGILVNLGLVEVLAIIVSREVNDGIDGIGIGWAKILVGIVCRMGIGVKLVFAEQWMLDSAAVDSFRVKEGLSIVVGLEERWGEMYLVIKVAMVGMTFDGTPMGVTHRLGTGNLIFVSGGLSTGIMNEYLSWTMIYMIY